MRYVPTPRGEIVEHAFEILPPSPAVIDPWRHAAHAAVDFWQRAYGEPSVSAGFEAIAADAGKVGTALTRLG